MGWPCCSDVSRVTVNIPNEDVYRLGAIALRHRTNRTSALVRAIRTTDYLDEAVARGARLVIVESDGLEREIKFC